MPIYTIVAAYPVDVEDYEMPRVEVRTHVVQGPSLQAAFERIKDHTHVVDATEVLGVEVAELCLSPDTKLRREEQLAQWESWSRWIVSADNSERPWTLLARGPESLQARSDRRFAERHPQLA